MGLSDAIEIHPNAMQNLLAYSWPGNVRELQNALARSLILSENGIIDVCDLPHNIARQHSAPSYRTGNGYDTLKRQLRDYELMIINTAIDDAAGEAFDKTALEEDLDDENRWRFIHQAPDIEAVLLDNWVNNMAVAWPLFPNSVSYTEVTLPPEGTDIGLDPFTLAIVKQDETDLFGLWDIVPVADLYQFVVLMGSIDPQLPATILDWDNFPQLTFVDTTTQPWTAAPQFPR